MKLFDKVVVEDGMHETLIGSMIVQYKRVYSVYYVLNMRVWVRRKALHITRPVDIFAVF